MDRNQIKALISQMTIEEKIGQMVQLNASSFMKSAAEITGPAQMLGIDKGFLKYVGSVLNFKNVGEVEAIQKNHMEEDRNKIPMLFMMDIIHGYRTIYPIPLALGASFNPETVKECSRMAAREGSSGGVQLTFTPMVDYVRDARWGRVMETCGEDVLLNSVMGAAQVEAFQGDDLSDTETLATCVKHFAAYGGAEAGRDYNTVEISERLLREYYLPAYKACIDAGVRMLMPSFNSLNGVPSVANKWLMRNVLKDEWNFNGVVISDYNAIGELNTHGVTENAKEAAELAFNCGCDIEMMSAAYYKHLKELIDEGKIDMAAVDTAVERVLMLKAELGLFDDPMRGASTEKEAAVCLTPEHRDIARRAAEECAVLLKNDGMLPLSTDIKKLALIGPFAASNEIKGFWSCHGEDSDCVSVADGVRKLVPDAEVIVAVGCSAVIGEDSTDGFAEAVRAAKDADAVILCLGETQKDSGEGNSRANIELTDVQKALAREVCAANANTAAVIFNGRPLVLTELDGEVRAILDMFFPGTEGGNAAANLLFGKVNPSGKVSMSFPKATGQCPIYYNHPRTGRPKVVPENTRKGYCSSYIDCGNLPLYPFGYGLSYTSFEYRSLELDKNELTDDGEINVRITLTNTGACEGKEVVQLYMHDLFASTVRPIASLIGFEKVTLAVGETKTVEFTVTEPMLRFYDFDCNHISEAGDFTLSTGHADKLILTKEFKLVK